MSASVGTSGHRLGKMRADVSDHVVGVLKEFYGKGPTATKTYINDEYVFVVFEGGLTRNEETLLEAGEHAMVRDYRLTFQEAMRGHFIGGIEAITGRRVLDYHSQIVFDPPRGFEIFVLEDAPA